MKIKKNSELNKLGHFFKEYLKSLPPYVRSDEKEKILFNKIFTLAEKKRDLMMKKRQII